MKKPRDEKRGFLLSALNPTGERLIIESIKTDAAFICAGQ